MLTHQHIDHIGLVGILARRSGAEVVALDLLAPVLEDFAAHAERDDELAEALMLRHGIPRDVVAALRAVSRAFRGWGGQRAGRPPAPPTASALEFAGRTLRVAPPARATRPRTRSSGTRQRAPLIAGDHLLTHISSNPLISRPLGGAGEPATSARRRC